MLNVLLPGTKSAIHRHTNTSEVIEYIYVNNSQFQKTAQLIINERLTTD